ncbi:MAG: glycoside hydrolase family 16 protein [Armatimonadetes bacterium]|nr:glycoside hydrolase family 16 protein [Armatimonadota bacterium]
MMHQWMFLLAGAAISFGEAPAGEPALKFSGYEWRVKSGKKLGPGPNAWNASHVRVDEKGWLRLRVAQADGQWACAEVAMTRRLGFGIYEFEVAGPVDRLDKNVVLGLFNYPTRDVGVDATHEIDIEFARWGRADAPIGNYTIWPVKKDLKQTTHSFECRLKGDESTHRFIWKPGSILFQSLDTADKDNPKELETWHYQPTDHEDRVSRQPMPVLINLWLFQGKAPSDGREVEIVIKRFRFTPE